MGGKNQKRLISVAFCLLLQFVPNLFAQTENEGQKDSLVRLMKGSSLQLIEKYGINYRKAVDATFLHNGTYLICDTALWNVDSKIINCEGHVQVIQGETILESDRLDYLIDEDLAQFRGTLVEMRSRENNILRTRHLDYNTRDSLAIFSKGASMRDKDGQIIESIDGTYSSVSKVFNFRNKVDMFTDSVFVKTEEMLYYSDADRADFVKPIDFWKDGNMLSANSGWYDHKAEIFFFKDSVHGMSKTQEAWCDTMYYYRGPEELLMLGNSQVQDTSRNIFGLADRILYQDTVSRITMTGNAAIAMKSEDNNIVDTLYMGADSITYYTFTANRIPEATFKAAGTRIEEMMFDPVAEFRKKAAEAAAAAAAEAAENDPNLRGARKSGPSAKASTSATGAASPSSASGPQGSPVPQGEEAGPEGPVDGAVSASAQADSVAVKDSTAVEVDTTKIGFMDAVGHVKLYRKDIQVCCDSMRYCDIDSIARFYLDPVIWNDGNRQYSSDSLFVLISNGRADRASLMSNAFIITQEDSICFDQIKGTDVMAYFDSTSALRRFDALGGAVALFFLREKDAFATVNKVESKMLSATMKQGTLDRVHYFESPKNDAYPLAQLPPSELKMKDFNWRPDQKPKGREDITDLKVIPSEREMYEARPETEFEQTDIYFPGYIKSVYKSIEDSKIRKREAERRRKLQEEKLSEARMSAAGDSTALNDSLAVLKDSLAALNDSLAVKDTLAGADSLGRKDSLAVRDSVAASDSLAVADSVGVKTPDASELRLQKRRERREKMEELRKLRIARRDARWAEMDRKDAAKKAEKERKALELKRERTYRDYLRQQKQEARDQAKLQKFIEQYEKQKIRDERKQQSESSRERPEGTQTGGDLQTPPQL